MSGVFVEGGECQLCLCCCLCLCLCLSSLSEIHCSFKTLSHLFLNA